MFSKKSNPFKKFVENTNKLAQTLQPQQQNVNQSSIMKKQLDYNDKGDRVSSRDDGGYTCDINKDSGTCTNNRTGEKVDVVRNNDNSWSIDTSNTGSKNTFGSNYPSNIKDNDKDYGGYSGSFSYGGSKSMGYSPQELHVINTVKALGNSVLGASTHDSRKDKGHDGYNASLKYVVESINQYGGSNGKKGFLFSDCDLTAHDMNYLSETMINSNHNFTIVDFSNNSQIGALGVDYLIKGAEGISHLQIAQTGLDNHNQGKPMMLMGKPFELPPEMLKSMMEQAKTINPDDYTYKGLLTRGNFNAVTIDISNCNIGDIGADIIGDALCKGRMPNSKHINVSGNNITDNGAKSFAEALKSGIPKFLKNLSLFGNKLTEIGEAAIVKALETPTAENIIVLTQQAEKHYNLSLLGNKEDKVQAMYSVLEAAQKRGVKVDNVVVDHSIKTWLQNAYNFTFKGVVGFAKCQWMEDPIGDYAEDKLIAKIPGKLKHVVKAHVNTTGTVSCVFVGLDNAYTSPEGVQLIKNDLDVLGASNGFDTE